MTSNRPPEDPSFAYCRAVLSMFRSSSLASSRDDRVLEAVLDRIEASMEDARNVHRRKMAVNLSWDFPELLFVGWSFSWHLRRIRVLAWMHRHALGDWRLEICETASTLMSRTSLLPH